MLIVMVWVLWGVVVALVIAVWALARQVGVLFERVSPIGALMIDAGPKIGSASPRFDLATLAGARLALGSVSARSTLLFFLSPTCPVCKKLLPILRGIRSAESDWLDVVLASDGDTALHQRFVATHDLGQFPYVLSSDLGMTFRVSRLPFAVLIGEDGVVKAKGLVNNREQLESLFSAKELGVTSVQDYLGRTAPTSTT
jgi:methylamine dehydrogenase accessory protein MauD